MIYYDGIDVSGGNDLNKTSKSKERNLSKIKIVWKPK